MPLYARSDLVSVHVSPAHGGCQEGTHRRPVEHGAPAKIWRLDCPDCENFLRSDPLWSTTVSEIPETHDERIAREDFEKRGAKDKDAIMTLALARLAGVDPALLPDSLTRMISGAQAHIPQTVACPAGHLNPLDQRFCGQCGQKVGSPALPAAAAPAAPQATDSGEQTAAPVNVPEHLETPTSAPEPPPVAPSAPQKAAPFSLPSNTKMRGMKREELGVLAGQAGVDAGGTRAELLERLIAANNGAKA